MSSSAIEDIVLYLFFPTIFLIPIDKNYPHLKTSINRNKAGYTCIIFIFNNMPQKALQEFNRFLLPEQTLKIFGPDNESISRLEYEMDVDKFMRNRNYEISYDLYINKKAPLKGSIDFFGKMQFF